MSADSEVPGAVHEPAAWLSVPEVTERLGLRQRDVRAMLRDHRLLAVRRGQAGAMSVPADLLVDDGGSTAVLPSLPGTLTLLSDAGYDEEESLRWLYRRDDQLGSTPVDALRAGRTHAVRRVAQTLAF